MFFRHKNILINEYKYIRKEINKGINIHKDPIDTFFLLDIFIIPIIMT